jgi:hypothetical protein
MGGRSRLKPTQGGHLLHVALLVPLAPLVQTQDGQQDDGTVPLSRTLGFGTVGQS